MEEVVYQGTGVSPGIIFAQVHVVARGFAPPEVYSISASQIPAEKERFRRALERTKEQLHELKEKIESISHDSEGMIFDAHLLVLEDQTVLTRVYKAVEERKQNAEFCFYAVMQSYLEAMRRVADPYLRERTADIEDVCQRVLRSFSGAMVEEEGKPDHRHILVAYDLSPSDTVGIDRTTVLGFATERGSTNSHTAILARSMAIPAIVGLEDAILNITTLSPAILDGYKGKLIIHPTEETQQHYREVQAKKQKLQSSLASLKNKETKTCDGKRITLSANMEFEEELKLVKESGAEGIGLYRTEFFLLEGANIPDENRQAALYQRIAEGVSPNQVIFRTLDAGGDKLPGEPLPEPEPNPFLGWRGIRFSLDRRDLFKEQLRAILRAGAHGKVGVMFPVVSGLREVKEALAVLDSCKQDLAERGIPYAEKIETGVMIEVPSAAMMAQEIAQEVDFLSIGTNDLIQYTVAVDRVNPRVAELYKPAHPAVLRLIKLTVEGGNRNRIWTGVCGEMAGDLTLLPLLIGLGVSELSVGASQLPLVKRAIRTLNYHKCKNLADSALQMPESRLILHACNILAEQSYPELL